MPKALPVITKLSELVSLFTFSLGAESSALLNSLLVLILLSSLDCFTATAVLLGVSVLSSFCSDSVVFFSVCECSLISGDTTSFWTCSFSFATVLSSDFTASLWFLFSLTSGVTAAGWEASSTLGISISSTVACLTGTSCLLSISFLTSNLLIASSGFEDSAIESTFSCSTCCLPISLDLDCSVDSSVADWFVEVASVVLTASSTSFSAFVTSFSFSFSVTSSLVASTVFSDAKAWCVGELRNMRVPTNIEHAPTVYFLILNFCNRRCLSISKLLYIFIFGEQLNS